MKKYLLGLVLMIITAIAFALPKPSDIESAMAQGNFSDAQSMTAEVLREHPESARAHLLNAYLLIHVQHDKVAANAELNTASGLDHKGDVKNSSLFGRTVAEIDLQKSQAAPRPQQVIQQTSSIIDSRVMQQPEKSHGHSGGFLIFLFIVGAGCVIVILFIRGANNKGQRIEPPTNYPPRVSSTYRESTYPQIAPMPSNPYYPTQPVIVQAQPASQGLGFGGQMAATAGGVIAGEAIVSAFTSRSKSRYSDDDYEERRRRDRAYDSTPAYTPDPYVDPVRDSSPVSASNERASYSSGRDDSWTPPAPATSYDPSPSYSSSVDNSTSWSTPDTPTDSW